MPKHETIVALGTPAGESALAIVRLSGPACLSLCQAVFEAKTTTQAIPPRSVQLGNYVDKQGQSLDQCVYILYPDEKSFTGEPMLEINCHGNPFIVQKIIQDMVARGCRIAGPGEFTRTAFMNGKIDLSQAEAITDVIRARSDKALDIAQKQLHGALGKRIHEINEELLQTIAEIEAYIDFPEEDLPLEDTQGPAAKLSKINGTIIELLNTHRYSGLIREGIKTVIIGAPNAGKSSLLNALIGEERALVSPIPGTTRDFIRERIHVGPYSLQIVDTAGIHETHSELEKLGIQKTVENIDNADLLLWVIDSSLTVPLLPEHIHSKITRENTLIVFNKIDLPKRLNFKPLCDKFDHVFLSTKTHEGFSEFKTILLKYLEKEIFIPTEESVIVNSRHAAALEETLKELTTGLEILRSGLPGELVASHLRSGLGTLGAITGKADNELILDKLFSSFCIGK